jgi:hypothetical protein
MRNLASNSIVPIVLRETYGAIDKTAQLDIFLCVPRLMVQSKHAKKDSGKKNWTSRHL